MILFLRWSNYYYKWVKYFSNYEIIMMGFWKTINLGNAWGIPRECNKLSSCDRDHPWHISPVTSASQTQSYRHISDRNREGSNSDGQIWVGNKKSKGICDYMGWWEVLIQDKRAPARWWAPPWRSPVKEDSDVTPEYYMKNSNDIWTNFPKSETRINNRWVSKIKDSVLGLDFW